MKRAVILVASWLLFAPQAAEAQEGVIMEPFTPHEQRVIADEIETERVRQYDIEEKLIAQHTILRAHGEPKPATPLHDFEEDLFNERMRAVEAAKQRLFSEDK